MKSALASALALCGFLAACATEPVGEAPMTWGFFDDTGEGPKLVLGVDGTDDVAVLFLCDPASGSINFNVPVGEESNVVELRLRSDGVTRRYDRLSQSEPDGYELAYFRTDRADPVLKRFVASGRLAVDVHGGFVSDDATRSSDRRAVAAFAKACRIDRG